MTYNPAQVAFVDVETTGLDPELDPIWQVAVIVDGVGHSWTQRLPGNTYVSDWVRDNTRFMELYVHDFAMSPLKSIERFVELVGDRHLVGACPWFDSERLHRLVREQIGDRLHPWHYHLIDVENLIVGFMLGEFSGEADEPHVSEGGMGLMKSDLPWDSRELSKLVGVDPDRFRAHDALDDAEWARACFEAVMGGPK